MENDETSYREPAHLIEMTPEEQKAADEMNEANFKAEQQKEFKEEKFISLKEEPPCSAIPNKEVISFIEITSEIYGTGLIGDHRLPILYEKKREVFFTRTIPFETIISITKNQKVNNNFARATVFCKDNVSYATSAKIANRVEGLWSDWLIRSRAGCTLTHIDNHPDADDMVNKKFGITSINQIILMRDKLKETFPEAEVVIKLPYFENEEELWLMAKLPCDDEIDCDIVSFNLDKMSVYTDWVIEQNFNNDNIMAMYGHYKKE